MDIQHPSDPTLFILLTAQTTQFDIAKTIKPQPTLDLVRDIRKRVGNGEGGVATGGVVVTRDAVVYGVDLDGPEVGNDSAGGVCAEVCWV